MSASPEVDRARRGISMPYHPLVEVDWSALEPHGTFLFRRVADSDRAVLGVGIVERMDVPRFGPDGRVDDWCFGHLAYDLKNELEPLRSRHPDTSGLPLRHWYRPRWVVEWRGADVSLHVLPGDEDAASEFCAKLFRGATRAAVPALRDWHRATGDERYLRQVEKLLHHIHRGDIYEVNYCMERSTITPGWDPFAAFGRLLEGAAAPFAAFHRLGDRFALCASPERFLAIDGRRVTAQPMKGTRPRSHDPVEDHRLALELATDDKERSENIMALDVARHDLSRIASSRSVRVEELCAVRPFGRVHQMTSTVTALLREGLTPMDAVYAAFPMASMTGAPKVRAMELIDAVEDQRRGLFSGTLGFFAPDGTADLNVVIRAALYDAGSGRVSLTTGSAITAACDPRRELEECELKARSVIDALGHA